MKNYDRYTNMTQPQYDKKGLMYFFCRKPSDTKIIPILKQWKRKNILDVGIGTGYYAGFLDNSNIVLGVDPNPHLCNLPIDVIQGEATEIAALLSDKTFDVIMSTWMTEYLNKEQFYGFLRQAHSLLAEDGICAITVIDDRGLGKWYTALAKKVKKIDKYSYSDEAVSSIAASCGFSQWEIIRLNSYFGMSWAKLFITKRRRQISPVT